MTKNFNVESEGISIEDFHAGGERKEEVFVVEEEKNSLCREFRSLYL